MLIFFFWVHEYDLHPTQNSVLNYKCQSIEKKYQWQENNGLPIKTLNNKQNYQYLLLLILNVIIV